MYIKIKKCSSFWGTKSPKPPTGALPLDPTGGRKSPRPPDFGPPLCQILNTPLIIALNDIELRRRVQIQ